MQISFMHDSMTMSGTEFSLSSSEDYDNQESVKVDHVDVDALIASAALYFAKVVKNDDQMQHINEIISTVLTTLVGDILSKKNVPHTSLKKDLSATFIRKLLNSVIGELHSRCVRVDERDVATTKNSANDLADSQSNNRTIDRCCERLRKRKEIHEVETSGKVFVSTSSEGRVSVHFDSFA